MAASAAVPRLYQATMVTLRSPAAPMRRMPIIASAQVTTPARTMPTGPGGSALPDCQGRSISSTPPSPASTALPRRGPTRSPSKGTERIVRNSGMAKPSAVTVASGSTA